MSGAVEGVPLLPCPFCGGEALQILHNQNLIGMEAVSCRNCGARGPHVETGKQATDGWNARALTTPPARSYADAIEDAAKWHDAEAAKARDDETAAQLVGFWDRVQQHQKRAAFHSTSAAAIRLLSQGGKA